jgi:D-galactarolactone cycloisomerase
MRVTEVACHIVQARVDRPFTSARGMRYTARTSALVEITTDAGLVGWGECYGPARIARAAIEHLAPMVVGRDPFDAAVIWEQLYNSIKDYGLSGITIAAISGIDIALHDLIGKEVGKPACKLLGGAFRDSVPAYATGLYFIDPLHLVDEAVDEAAGYVQQGFRAIKMKIGIGDLAADIARIRAVREAIGPDVRLAVDANHCFTVPQAIRVGRALEALDILWFEEPVAPEDIAGYCDVTRALDVAVAGGENEFTRWGFRAIVERKAMDIVQPDVCAAGGLGECMRIAALCTAHGVECVPHAWGSAIGLAATLQFLAALPDQPPAWRPFPPLLEFEQTPNPLRDALAVVPITLSDGGVVRIPDGPGLGIEIDRSVLEQYRIA